MSSETVITYQEFFSILLQRKKDISLSTLEKISEVYAKYNKIEHIKKLTEIVKTSKTESEILEALKKL